VESAASRLRGEVARGLSLNSWSTDASLDTPPAWLPNCRGGGWESTGSSVGIGGTMDLGTIQAWDDTCTTACHGMSGSTLCSSPRKFAATMPASAATTPCSCCRYSCATSTRTYPWGGGRVTGHILVAMIDLLCMSRGPGRLLWQLASDSSSIHACCLMLATAACARCQQQLFDDSLIGPHGAVRKELLLLLLLLPAAKVGKPDSRCRDPGSTPHNEKPCECLHEGCDA
jgi:hypothetical protein